MRLYNKLKNLSDKLTKTGFDLFLITFFILVVILCPILFCLIGFDMKLSLSYLIIIYGIVGTILSSLFIFIMAEGLRDKTHPYKIKIFFNESKIITIIVLFLFSLVFLPFHEFYQITLTAFFIALLVFIGFGIYAIRQIALITLNSEELWKKHINLFRNRIEELTKFIIDIKFRNHHFLQVIKDQKNKKDQFIELEYSYPIESERKNMLNLKSTKKGTIIDIDPVKLKSIFNEINEIYKKKRRQYFQNNENKIKKKTTIPIEEGNEKESFPYKIHIIFCVKGGDEIRKNTPILFYNKFYDDKKHDYENIFQEKTNNIITTNETTVIDEVKIELEDFKSMMIEFIKSKNKFQFERYFSLYLDLAEVFLNELSKHGQFSYQDAKQYTSIMNFGKNEGWPPLTWLRNHVIDLFKEVKDFKSNKLYKKIQWLPYHLICLSQEKK